DQKWPEYAPYCDRFYFAVDCDFPKERLPEACGMMVCDGFGGAILRECEPAPLNAARRKAVTLAFARLAASRLMRTGEAGASPAEPAID
ncbi:MAG TPA: MmcB family DNA repair protein, partial [Hyphomonadaceae bacterium]|nr:MmcB family DNA repair protein [Hyphomonadaceae bacterium]